MATRSRSPSLDVVVGAAPLATGQCGHMKAAPLCASLLWLAACSGEATSVTSPMGAAFEPDLVVSADHIAVAWYDSRSIPSQIYFRLYNHSLTPLGNEHRISDASLPAFEASTAFISNALAVAWYEVARNGAAQVHVGVWEFDGTVRWRKTLSEAGQRARIPVLREHENQLFIAWIEDAALEPAAPPQLSTLHFAWLDSAGAVQSTSSIPNAAGATTWNLNATPWDAETMAVSYHAQRDTEASELHLALVSSQEARVVRLSADDGVASLYPDLAPNGDTLALTWFDEVDQQSEVKLSLFPRGLLASDAPLALDEHARAVTSTPGESIGAYLTWANDTLGLAWNDNSAGQHELYFQHFDLQGEPLGDAQRLTRTRTASLIPAIESIEDDFVLSWSEVQLNGHESRHAAVILRLLTP